MIKPDGNWIDEKGNNIDHLYLWDENAPEREGENILREKFNLSEVEIMKYRNHWYDDIFIIPDLQFS